MSNMLDLDAVLPGKKTFKLKKKEFNVSTGYTVEEALKIQQIAQNASDGKTDLKKQLEIIWDFLDAYNDKDSKEFFFKHLKIQQIPKLVEFIFGTVEKEVKEDEVYDNRGEVSGR